LFGVEMWALQGGASATTLATAVIHPSLRRVNLGEQGVADLLTVFMHSASADTSQRNHSSRRRADRRV
jgi:hypothetical protein